jgi:anti-sigma regulatory factor (Ser/Thr protein kinase)
LLTELYEEEFEIDGQEFVTIGIASTRIKSTLKMLGIPSDLVRRTSIIAYEAEMNLVIHGGGGILRFKVHPDHIMIQAEDHGPGIPDIELAMKEGYTTASDQIRELGFGAGMGLPNIKRNSDTLDIQSTVGEGTFLTSIINLPGV